MKRTIFIILVSCLFWTLQAGTISPQAASNQENYDYRYIAELYAAGESDALAEELRYFYAQYPESEFLPYLRYMEANLKLEKGQLGEAREMYEELLQEPLSQEVMAVMLLNYATCLHAVHENALALQQLQRIDAEFPQPAVVVDANILRGKIHEEMGQYYSAERYYRQAHTAIPEDMELRYRLFSTQLKLNMDEAALEMIDDQALGSGYGLHYAANWLQYLLNSGRLNDFSGFVQNRLSPQMASKSEIKELQIKRALLIGDNSSAESLLNAVTTPTDATIYFHGLLLVQNGDKSKADSLFATLVKQAGGDIAAAAYLERLKILYEEDQAAAIGHLEAYLRDNPPQALAAEAYYTLGHFLFSRKDYQEALKKLGMARQLVEFPDLSSRIDFLIAECWNLLERKDMALEAYHRYLNLYPEGSSADAALYRIGYLQFVDKNYNEARKALQSILSSHPESRYTSEALYYLGEIEFFLANYNQALDFYHDLFEQKPGETAVQMRLAQSYYYLGNYNQAAAYIGDLKPAYETMILSGVIKFALKDFSAALDLFIKAEQSTTVPLFQREARSYRALCLFQMKRYKEASALYKELSVADENPDTYMFLSAKSAFAAEDYHQALELYDSFIDQYPKSRYYYQVLADIATAFYNMGDYEQAVNDYLNLLIQFRNNREFTPEETEIVQGTLLGIELGMKKVDNQELTDRLLMMPETFMSQFISFELNLIILKLYYDTEEWSELLVAAEELRAAYPSTKAQDVQMLMISALINLDQYAQADSMLSDAYTSSPTSEVLLKWAELEQATGQYVSALEKYQQAYSLDKRPQTWIAMLLCSQSAGYISFEALWNLASPTEQQLAEAMLIKLDYLYRGARFAEASFQADEIIAANLSPHDHATAFLTKGKIAFARGEYPATVALMKRVIVLFPDFPEIRSVAAYHVVNAYLKQGATSEADTIMAVYKEYLSKEQMLELDRLRGAM